MAIRLNEEIIQELIKQVNEANPGYHFDWRTYAITTQQEGRRTVAALLVENSDYFALIRLAMFDVSEAISVDFLAKSEIQGAKVRKGLINTVLRLRMYNGEFYKLIFNPNGGKDCPRHADNVGRYRDLFELEFANQRDMKDRSTGLFGKLGQALMWILATLATILTLIYTKSKFLAFFAFIAVALICSWLMDIVTISSAKREDYAYKEEFTQLAQTYPNASVEEMYRLLQQMQNKPQTDLFKAAYYSSLVELAHQLGRDEEAQLHLAQFPRRYSEKTEEQYQGMVNLLASPPEDPNGQSESLSEPAEKIED